MRNLFLGWIFFILLPAFALSTLVESSLKWEEARIVDQGKAHLLQEMQAFISELEPPTYLKSLFKRELRRAWRRRFQNPGVWEKTPDAGLLKIARLELEQRLGFRLLGLVAHGPDLRAAGGNLDPGWAERLTPGMLSKLFWTANRLDQHRQATSSLAPAWVATMRATPHPDLEKRFYGFFSMAVGNGAETEFEPGEISWTISRWLHGGRLCWLYLPFFRDRSPDSPLLGGIFVLAAERDIAPKSLLDRVSRTPLHRQMTRSSHLLPTTSANAFLKDPQKAILRFTESKAGLSLLSRPGNWFLGLVAGRGTIHLERPAERLILRTTLRARHLSHQLRPLVPGFNRLLVFVVACGSAGFLYLWLFGFVLPIRLRGKILLGAGVAAALPMTLLLWGTLMQRQIDQDRSLAAVQERLALGHSLLDRSLQGYLLTLNQRILSKQRPLQSLIVDGASQTAAFRTHMAGLPVNAIMGLDSRNRSFFERLQPTPEDFLEKVQVEAITGLVSGLVQGLRGRRTTKQPTMTIHGAPFLATGLGDYLSRPGKFLPFQIGSRYAFLAGLPLVPPAEAGGVASTGLLVFRALPEDILMDFFKTAAQSLDRLQGTIGPWNIRTVILPLDVSTGQLKPGTMWAPHGAFWKRFSRYAELAATLQKGFALPQSDRTSLRVVSTFLVPRYPALALSWAEAPRENPWSGIPIAVGLYFLLLIWFVISLLDFVFRQPILGFVTVAEAIKRGEYPRVDHQQGGDEFSRLGTSFDSMVQGLRHRDELSHFVSDEVMETLESGSEESLKPGGELMEVTVLFAGLRGFRAWAGSVSPDESVQALNVFLETSSTVFRTCGGNLDKIVEETVMAVFRKRPGLVDPAVRAVNAAFALQQTLATAFPIGEGGFPQHPPCDIGIASGTVLSGRIGSRHGTLDYSVIGNAVNLAARLKVQAKKAIRTGIIVSPATIRDLRGRYRLEFLDRVEIKGLSREFSLYEVLAAREAA